MNCVLNQARPRPQILASKPKDVIQENIYYGIRPAETGLAYDWLRVLDLKRKLIWMDNPTIFAMLSLPTRQLTVLSILTAMCIGFQLTPRPPNVEFTSLIVFVVGALYGIPIGAGLGILVMFINGFFSPWGFGGLIIPFQIIMMAVVGIGGGLYKRKKAGSYDVSSFVETAILGAFLTLLYDVITNLGYAITSWLAEMPILIAIISAMVWGAPFSLVHIVSNTIVFAVLFFPVASTLRKLLGGEHHWKREPLLT